MAQRKGKCIQFGGCSVADAKEVIEVQAGEEFVCKECGKPLQPIEERAGSGSRSKAVLLVLALVVAVVGGGLWAFWPRNPYPEEPPVGAKGGESAPASTPTGAPAVNTGAPAPGDTYACGLKPIDQPDVARLLAYLKQGMTYASQNRYELALKEFDQVQKIDPNFLAMHENIAAAQLKLKKLTEAESHLQEELKLIGCLEQVNDASLPKFAYMLEVGQKGAGDAEAARTKTMRERLRQATGVAHYNLACVRARQGAPDAAITELRHAVEKGFSDVSALKRDPDLAAVRSAPGFQEVVSAASSNAPDSK